ncbi:MAG: EF-hand domain-containing protein [Rhodobacteraceae bacterium]|nr:EF-hand domain-containing protein [Paracoccaceae bacterium]
MTTNKIIPVAALAVLMGLSGAMIATAQNLEENAANTTTTAEAPIQVRHARDDGERRHGRGERGGPMGGEMFRAMFTEADTNSDGSVSAEELTALRDAKVALGDTNADGALTLAEFQTIWQVMMQPQTVDAFQHVDADGDGTITAAELDALVTNALDRMDRNGDGLINQDDRRRGDRG